MTKIADGDTVLLKAPAGTFLRREIQYGIATVEEEVSSKDVDVTWANGTAATVRMSALTAIRQASDETRQMLLSYRQSQVPGTRGGGIVVAAYFDVDAGHDMVVIESTLGLLFVTPAKEAKPVEGK